MARLSIIRPQVARLVTQPSFVLGLAMIVMLWAAVAYKFKDQATRDHDAALQNLGNLALLFEANALHAIREVDKALFYMRREVEQAPAGSDLTHVVANPNLVTETTLHLAVIGPDGKVRASNVSAQLAGRMDVSDRDYFDFHRSNSSDELFASKPVLGRITKKMSIPLTRRVNSKDNTFGGLVLASLDPEHFKKFYGALDLGPTGSVTLLGMDGIVRASVGAGGRGRYPVGDDLAGAPLLQKVHGHSSGTFMDTAADGHRVVSFRRIRGLPLAVGVGVSKAQIYAPAYRDAIKNALLAALLTLVILAVGSKGARDQLRLRLAKAKLLYSQRHALQKSEHLGLTLDNMTQGIILVTDDGRMPVINRRAVELLDLPENFLRVPPKYPEFVRFLEDRGEYAGVPIPEGMSALEYFTRWNASGGFDTYERMRPNGIVLEVRTSPLPGGGFVRTFTDVTPNRQAQEAVVRAS